MLSASVRFNFPTNRSYVSSSSFTLCDLTFRFDCVFVIVFDFVLVIVLLVYLVLNPTNFQNSLLLLGYLNNRTFGTFL